MVNVFKILKDACSLIESDPSVVYGYWIDVRNALASLSYDKTKDGTKYPLIIINAGTTGISGEVMFEGEKLDSLRFYLITQAKLNESFENKMLNRYEAILFPLLDDMIKALEKSNKVRFYNKNSMKTYEYEYTLLPYIKTDEKEQQNQLHDIVDAMEIKFKNFTLKNL